MRLVEVQVPTCVFWLLRFSLKLLLPRKHVRQLSEAGIYISRYRPCCIQDDKSFDIIHDACRLALINPHRIGVPAIIRASTAVVREEQEQRGENPSLG